MDILQVLAEPTRRAIVQLVWDDERSAGDIAAHFPVTFGAVSQHLAVLRQTGCVTVRRDGTRRYYRADRAALEPFEPVLRAMWGTTLAALGDAVERDQEAEDGE